MITSTLELGAQRKEQNNILRTAVALLNKAIWLKAQILEPEGLILTSCKMGTIEIPSSSVVHIRVLTYVKCLPIIL